MLDNQELVWVDKEFAEQYKALSGKENERELQIEVFEEYIKKVKEASRRDFKSNLENLEEDVAIYAGLMLKVKQAFEKAKNEQLNASYELWEKFDEEIPKIEKKISGVTEKLQPLQIKIEEVNKLMGKVSTWEIESLSKAIQEISRLYGTNKEMVEFLIKNFKPKKEKKQ